MMRRIVGPLLFVASLMLLAPAVSIVKAQYTTNPFLVPTGSQLLLPDGTAAAPSLAFASDDTNKEGLFRIVNGLLGITIEGTERFRFGAVTSWSSSTNFGIAADVLMTRGGAAATLQLGAADAAAPVAQTLQAQGVAAGTSDVSGANLTITSGNGRGSAAVSSLIFQTPTAVGSGSGAQTQTTRLTFTGAAATFTGNVVATNFGSSTQILTTATMTYSSGWQRGYTHEFLWTNAQVVALGASTTGDITVATLPAKTQLLDAAVVILTPDTSANALTVSCGDAIAGTPFINYIVPSDAKAAANTYYGDLLAERGTAIDVENYYLPSYTATTLVTCHFIKTVTNLNTVTGSTGRVILTTRLLP